MTTHCKRRHQKIMTKRCNYCSKKKIDVNYQKKNITTHDLFLFKKFHKVFLLYCFNSRQKFQFKNRHMRKIAITVNVLFYYFNFFYQHI